MLRAGVIRRSHSPFCSPIVMVGKKDGGMRFCVDYRQLNEQTEDEVAQLPAIREMLPELGSATIFTTLDLKAGYWQVPMAEQSIPLTAFSTPEGATYEFLVMPFGLKCAPSTFQKLMTEVLAGYVDVFTKVYLDDIIVYSQRPEDHPGHVRRVLERLQTHGLKCAITKCVFGADQLNYLGHRVTAGFNEAQTGHLEKARNFPPPKSIRDLRSFLGTAGWLRDYVPRFAEITAPLTNLVGRKKFEWTREAADAFDQLRQALATPLHLSRPDPNLPYTLQTDASGIGMGAVLFQETPDGERRVVACASAKLKSHERRYHCNEQEVLAAVWACKRYRQYLEDRKFILKTDSRALQWLKKYHHERAKLTRYALLLQEFNFEVVHCPGRDNQLPDYLSRNPTDEEHTVDEDRLVPPKVREVPVKEEKPAVNVIQARPKRIKPRRYHKPTEVPLALIRPIRLNRIELEDEGPLYERIVRAQRASVEYEETRARWHRFRTGEEKVTQRWQATLRDNYVVEDDLVWYTGSGQKSLVVPLNYWPQVLYKYHDSTEAGHPGRDETTRAISRLYYWPAMKRQVKTYVKHCLICASTKQGGRHQQHAPLRPRAPTRPWETISLDVMGPYLETTDKNKYIIVATDLCSKWVEAQAVPEARTTTVLRFLEHVCHRWGYPAQTITDNGSVFRSSIWERFHERHGIDHFTTPIYHQRANPVERRNQELVKMLRVHVMESRRPSWDRALSAILFALRDRANAATGLTPAETLLGAPLVRSGEWAHPKTREQVRNKQRDREERLKQVRRRQSIFQRRLYPYPRAAPVRFVAGQQVLVRNFGKAEGPLAPTWVGPHPIVKVCGDGVYEVDRNGSQFKVHVDDLRLWERPEGLVPGSRVRASTVAENRERQVAISLAERKNSDENIPGLNESESSREVQVTGHLERGDKTAPPVDVSTDVDLPQSDETDASRVPNEDTGMSIVSPPEQFIVEAMIHRDAGDEPVATPNTQTSPSRGTTRTRELRRKTNPDMDLIELAEPPEERLPSVARMATQPTTPGLRRRMESWQTPCFPIEVEKHPSVAGRAPPPSILEEDEPVNLYPTTGESAEQRITSHHLVCIEDCSDDEVMEPCCASAVPIVGLFP